MFFYRVVFCLLVYVLALVSASISCSEEPPLFYEKEIIVTASKYPELRSDIPWSMTTITSQEIKSCGARTLADALRFSAGVDVASFGYMGGASLARIRASSSQQVLVLIDGQKINSPMYGGSDLSDIKLSNVAKIEIVRSPASAVYGSDAVGGVINVITKQASKENEGEAIFSYGTYNTQLKAIKFDLHNSPFGIMMGYDNTYSDGFRKNSKYSGEDYLLKITRDFYSSKLIFDLSQFYAEKGIPGSLSYPSLKAYQDDRKTLLSLSYLYSDNEKINFSTKIYQRQEKEDYSDPDLLVESGHGTVSTGFEMQTSTNFKDGAFLIGMDVRNDKANSGNLLEKESLDSIGAYAQYNFKIGNTSNYLGARSDISKYGGIISPRVGSVFHANKSISFKASASSSFRAPNFNELFGYYPPYYPGGLPYTGNPDLKPEKGMMCDVGAEYVWDKNTILNLDMFSGNSRDLITSSWPINESLTAFQPVNLNETASSGMEFGAERKINDLWKIFLNYTDQYACDVNTKKQLFYTPRNKYNIGVNFDNGDIGVSLIGKYVGERKYQAYDPITFAPIMAELPSHSVFDLVAYKKAGDFELRLILENLFDEKYEEFADYPEPGRRASFQVSYKNI